MMVAEIEWMLNEHGHWCSCCGYLVAGPDAGEGSLPEECSQCGFPDAEAVADYHFGPDDDQDEDTNEFDCPPFWTPEGWFCPAQGSEDCDWECPHS